MVADFERPVHCTWANMSWNLLIGGLAEVRTELYGMDVVRCPSIGRHRDVPIGDLRPRGDDDRRFSVGIAHDDDESNAIPFDRKSPAVGRVPAELAFTNGVAHRRDRDISSWLCKSLPEVIGQCVHTRVPARWRLRCASRLGLWVGSPVREAGRVPRLRGALRTNIGCVFGTRTALSGCHYYPLGFVLYFRYGDSHDPLLKGTLKENSLGD